MTMAHTCAIPGRIGVQRDGNESRVSRGSTPLLHTRFRTSGDQLVRTQSTDALLSELFHDLLQQEQTREPHTSRCGDRGVNHATEQGAKRLNGELEAKISKACENYEQCVHELASVERHLLQAKARALTEEEKTLSERKVALCGYEDVGLPSGGSSLGSFLDKKLLEKHHLLHPTHYIHSSTHSTTSSRPIQASTPTYLQPTFTSTQHTSTPLPAHTPTSQVPPTQKPSWKNQLTLAERDADRKALARLRQRGNYLCNPRYSTHPQPNTASHGALRKREKATEPPDSGTGKKVPLFIAEPKEVVFTDYQVGHTYQVDLDIRNVSGSSRQMRIVPLNSPYFTVTRGVCSHPEGLIAPGMSVTCTVTFTPHSLCNYHEDLKVLSHSGQDVVVPIMAVRPPPCLSLPESIDCGCCLAGGVRKIVLQVDNTGGEGRFSIRHPLKEDQADCVLQLGPFSISPTDFHLRPRDSTLLQVTFSPDKEGKYGEHFTMECDNGETLPFSLTGVADVLSAGCVYIGDSSSQQVAQFTSGQPANQQVDPLISTIDYDLYTERLEECNITFDAANPRTSSYKTVVIRNYSNVDLPFSWKLFRPLTELHSSGKEDPIISDLVPSANPQFSVFPSSGTLPALSNHIFLCQFLPHKCGEFSDVAHLVVPDVPAPSLNPASEGELWRRVGEGDSISCACVLLRATAQQYVLEMQPPALLLSVAIPLASETKRRVKMVNKSVSTLHYTWRQPQPQEGITIMPTSGSIVSGGGAYCEVVIVRRVEGEFSLCLTCDIQHSPHPVTLPLHGWTEGPQISVDCSSLQFGLVPLGTSSPLTLTLTSHTNTSLAVEMRQAVREGGAQEQDEDGGREAVMDHACLHFTPSHFTLLPHSNNTVTVECHPLFTGRLRSIVQCEVEGKVIRCVGVYAEVQRPVVTLSHCRLHEDTAYLGIGVERTVEMSNTTLIPTHFTWRTQLLGSSATHCNVTVSPLSGNIGPRETISLTLTITWNSLGTHSEAVLCCDVEGMEEPLLLLLSAQVYGRAVSYSVKERSTDDVCLDFGRDNSLLSPHTLHLLVTNTTAIPAHLTTRVKNFPPSQISTTCPPLDPHPTPQKRALLSRTVNIGDANSRTSRQANKDYVSGLLSEGYGCCFVVDPSSSPLLPFTTHTLTITAYSDMWGDYHDTLLCQVSGLDDMVEIPIHCNMTGCPLVFHSTAQPQHTLIRFGSHSPNSQPAQRVIRINNTSPEDIRIDWQVFNILQEDSDVVDLITTIGPPFPKNTHSPSHPAPSPPSIDTSTVDQRPCGGVESRHNDSGHDGGSKGVSIDEEIELDSDPVVHVVLRGHEGVRAMKPFTIHPIQMVVPARGQSSVKVTFHPSVQCVSGLGSNLSAYCLGYMSLDHQHLATGPVRRVTGYELNPLRVDLEASVEQPQLHLEADSDHGLHFNYPASILLLGDQVLPQVSKTHHATFVNRTSSVLSFKFSSTSPHFTVTPSPSQLHHGGSLTLPPHNATTVDVLFHLARDDLRGCSAENISFSHTLQVHFSTGAVQEFSLSAEVCVPHVSVCVPELELGHCLLDHSLSSTLTLCNTTHSALPWTIHPSHDLQDVVRVSPSSGVLLPHLNTDTPRTQSIHLTFTPDTECEYKDSMVVTEVLTGCKVQVALTASGTTDERHII